METKTMGKTALNILNAGEPQIFGYGSKSPYGLSKEFLTLPN